MKNVMYVLLVVTTFFSCSTDESSTDVVRDIPKNEILPGFIQDKLNEITSSTTVAEAKIIIAESSLAEYHLRRFGGDEVVKRLAYNFLDPTSKDAFLTVTDKVGNEIEGVIRSRELVLTVDYVDLTKSSENYFVHCTNGLISKVRFSEENFIGEEIYNLSYGEGPMHYGATLDDLWSMVRRYNLGKNSCNEHKLYFAAYYKNRRLKKDLSTRAKVKKCRKKLMLEKGGCKRESRILLEPNDRFRKDVLGEWHYVSKE